MTEIGSRSARRAVTWGMMLGVALVAGVVPAMVRAERIAIEAPTVNSKVSRPSGGMTMTEVEAKFGAPARRMAPVGDPPITRWHYPGFTVYFERDRVIHTVVDH